MKIGITGINGLIGWHLRAFLHGQPGVEVIAGDRSTFADETRLENFVSTSDVIVHLAGLNRGDDQEIESTNIELTRSLIAACEQKKHIPHIIFSSSTHIYRDSAYGRSKKICAQDLREWAARNHGVFTNLILPHVFGELGKPFYNSVVSTFCHQVANGEEPRIDQDGRLELVHAQEVARRIYELVTSRRNEDVVVSGNPITVSSLLEKIHQLADSYSNHVIPDLRDTFSLDLFNTYRSYLFPGQFPRSIKLHKDNRGELFEACKNLNGGQIFLSTTHPGITRGNHYHLSKVERFLVVRGEAIIRIRRLFHDEIFEYPVSGRNPQYIDIPTLHTHNITNTGDKELLTLFWAHEIFDPNSADTVAAPV
ncbi:MAG: NAD-dependent epimerase/dehydratase family protein [Nitrospinota bacterium]|nr:NAD-dependent epimerase/dehydratase family protein [Nitrospinota bacterium]